MTGLKALQHEGGMTWTDPERGWLAVPADVIHALVAEGFEESKRVPATSRRDRQPAGGVWQGVNRTTGSMASCGIVNERISRSPM